MEMLVTKFSHGNYRNENELFAETILDEKVKLVGVKESLCKRCGRPKNTIGRLRIVSTSASSRTCITWARWAISCRMDTTSLRPRAASCARSKSVKCLSRSRDTTITAFAFAILSRAVAFVLLC